MNRRTLRNIAIMVAVVFIVRTMLALMIDTSTAVNVVIGAVVGAVALVMIDLVEGKRDVQ